MNEEDLLKLHYLNLVKDYDSKEGRDFAKFFNIMDEKEHQKIIDSMIQRIPLDDLIRQDYFKDYKVEKGIQLSDYFDKLLQQIKLSGNEYGIFLSSPVIIGFSPDSVARASVRPFKHGYLILVNSGLTFLTSFFSRRISYSMPVNRFSGEVWIGEIQPNDNIEETGIQIGRVLFYYLMEMGVPDFISGDRVDMGSRGIAGMQTAVYTNHFNIAHEFSHLINGHIEGTSKININTIPQFVFSGVNKESWEEELIADATALSLLFPPSVQKSIEPTRARHESTYALIGAINSIMIDFLIRETFEINNFRKLVEYDIGTNADELKSFITSQNSHPPTQIRIDCVMGVANEMFSEFAIHHGKELISWYNAIMPYALTFIDFLSEKILTKNDNSDSPK